MATCLVRPPGVDRSQNASRADAELPSSFLHEMGVGRKTCSLISLPHPTVDTRTHRGQQYSTRKGMYTALRVLAAIQLEPFTNSLIAEVTGRRISCTTLWQEPATGFIPTGAWCGMRPGICMEPLKVVE